MNDSGQPAEINAGAPRESPWVVLRSASPNPLIYQKMVRQVDPAAQPGDVVAVYDKSGEFFGRAIFNPRSQIWLRMLTARADAVDEAFWRKRLAEAFELRKRWQLHEQTDAYRLVHAEGDGLSGLILERYADCLVFELFSLGMWQRVETLARIAGELLGTPTSLDRPQKAAAAWRVVARADRRIEQIEGFRVPPPTAEAERNNPVIREHGVRYRVETGSGHKTGFFCDQRENRRRLAELCRDGSLLDMCCYTGGFSLCAKILGRASEVTAVDLDEAALETARENANLNQTRVEFVHADAFVYLRQMIANQRTYDTVVLDPPKFAMSREGIDEALARYYDLNVLAAQAVRRGGVLLTCSCSGLVSREMFAETVLRALRRVGRATQILDYTGAGVDHPVMINCPESAYLKALWLRIL